MTTKRKLKSNQDGSLSKIKKNDKASVDSRQLKSVLKYKPKVTEVQSMEPKKAVAFSPNIKEKKGNLNELSDKSKIIKKGKNNPKVNPKVPAKKKERKAFYKAAKNNYELVTNAKKIWEKFRNTKNKEKIPENAEQLYDLIKGHASQLVFAHDTSRVIESVMLLAPENIKDAIYEELKGEIIKMAQSKYAKFFLMSLLKHGKKEQKTEVITVLTGDIIRLMKHTEAANVVEVIFNEYASTAQRRLMIESFYGAVFKLYQIEGEQGFSDIMKNREKKQGILEFMKKTLVNIVEKSIINCSLVHKVLFDYLEYCTEADRNEMIDTIKMSVVQILHTANGRRVAMKCIWCGSAKIRKIIVKSFKTHVTKICKEKQGHFVLLAIFDCVDDTEIVKKIIIQEIIKDFKDIISDPEGRKVILYLLARRNNDFTTTGVTDILKEGDANKISKKDPPIREREIFTSFSTFIVKFFLENAKDLIFDPNNTNLAQAIVIFCLDSRSSTLEKVASFAAEPFTLNDETHIIENYHGHFFLKKLLKYDKMFHEKSQNVELFCEKLMSVIEPENILKWIDCNRGTFTIIHLIETGVKSVIVKLKQILKPVHKQLAEKSFPGTEILLKLLT